MSILSIDFETRSTVDLKKTTTDVYAKDSTTDVWCMAYAFDDDAPSIIPFQTDIDFKCGWVPKEIADHLKNNGIVYGHNTTFEWNIWNKLLVPRYGWPELKIEQCRCTMTMAYAMGLPGSLENAAAAVGLDVNKDMSGHRLMLKMAKPRVTVVYDNDRPEERYLFDKIPSNCKADNKSFLWWDDEDHLQRLYAYCKRDVEVERELHKRLRELSEKEQKIWFMDQKINERGVHIDVPAAKKAIKIVSQVKDELDVELNQLTKGAVGSYRYVNVLTDWVRSRGVETAGMAKADAIDLLKQDIPADVRRAVEIRQEGAKSSTAKIETMLNCLSDDNRVRGLFQYYAATTGRWGGRKIQPQNFPRPKIEQDEIEFVFDNLLSDVDDLRVFHDNALDTLSSCLRGFMCAAPGKTFMAADFSNIEGRALAWEAGEEWKLDAFRAYDRGDGPDLYKVTAGSILGISPKDVSKDQRQVLGKTPELALGYEGGVGAFATMSGAFGINMADYFDTVKETLDATFLEKAEEAYEQRGSGNRKAWVASEAIKLAWRDRHPATVNFWRLTKDAAILAVENPGQVYKARCVKFVKKGSFLMCQLPSKRIMYYPYPRVESSLTPWGSETKVLYYKTVDALTKKWGETATYGGKLVENITQAIARDVLADAMLRLQSAEFEMVLHIHDEIVCEVKKGTRSLSDLESIMAQVPNWAIGFPIAVEGWQGKRFRK